LRAAAQEPEHAGVPGCVRLNQDVLAGKRQDSSVLKSAMGTLPDRYQSGVRMYYADGKTMREIGSALGINESRASQIHRAALEKMAQNL
jgi:RNA polymerase sigma factor for flagellar operon FliA